VTKKPSPPGHPAGPGPAGSGLPPDTPRRDRVIPLAQGDIVFHATVAAVAAFIPLPFLDDYVERQVRRHLVRRLYSVHGVRLDPDASGNLGLAPGRLARLSRKAVMIPLKRAFRQTLFKTFLVMDVKYCVDAFSAMYHAGYLFDHALQQGWAGERSPAEIRSAVDRVCATAGTSPVNHVVTLALRQSGTLFLGASRALYRMVFNRSAREENLFDRIGGGPAELASLTEKLQTALNRVPPNCFRALQTRLEAELAATDPEGSGNAPGTRKKAAGRSRRGRPGP